MKITKEELKKLILEEYKRSINEAFPFSQSGTIDTNKQKQPQQKQPQQKVDPKQELKKNAGQQLKLLRFMKETLKQVKPPQELQTMIDHIKKAGTPDFLTQVLNVEKSIPINIGSVLTNPFELLQAIIDEVLKSAIQKANQKLAEGKKEYDNIMIEEYNILEELKEAEIHFNHDPDQRLEKHKRKEIKKHHDIPKPNLSDEELKKIDEIK